jgi:glucokinase
MRARVKNNGHKQLTEAHPGGFIAADVGGTHARMAVVGPGVAGQSGFTIQSYQKYRCAEFESLAAIFEAFRDQVARTPIRTIALAIAGHIVDDKVINVNLPWPVSISKLRGALGVLELAITNDFEAIAHAIDHIETDTGYLLNGPATPPRGPVLVVGPGTGLGAAVRIPQGRGSTILATEAGQATLAAGTDVEIEILRELRKQSRHVLIESVLSGTGLKNLDAALRRMRGAPAVDCTPAQITAAAVDGSDPQAVETVEIFCAWFGGVLGDLALLYGATGGIYLAGGVLPQMKELLIRSAFVERFLDKGAMREALVHTPVRLIDHAQLGVIGAAGWYFDREQNTPRAPQGSATTRNGVSSTVDSEEPASGARATCP